jgi:hypothetical protein
MFLLPDRPQDKKSEKVLRELENIDDEADQLGIAFVKIADEELAEEYSLSTMPTLVYYRNSIPVIYEGKNQLKRHTHKRLGLLSSSQCTV